MIVPDDRSVTTPAAPTNGDRRAAASHPEFGQALAKLRGAQGLNKKQLALRARVSPSTVTRLEAGGRGVSRAVVAKLARALETSPDQYHQLLRTAGFLTEEAAALLEEPELAQLSRLLSEPMLHPRDRRTLLTYIQLALDHATALGYVVRQPWTEQERPPDRT